MSHIFISYSKKNREYTQSVVKYLLEYGYDVWIDNDKIEYGANWWEAIVDGINQSAAVIVIMTPESKASEWVVREVFLAIEYKKPIFPLLKHGENWELFVATQYVDVSDGRLPNSDLLKRISEYITPNNQIGNRIDIIPTIGARSETTEHSIAVPELLEEFYKAHKSGKWGVALKILGQIKATGKDLEPFDADAYEIEIQHIVQIQNEATMKYNILRTITSNEPSPKLIVSFNDFQAKYPDYGDPENLRFKTLEFLQKNRFKVVVVGQFNVGKSTLINAILGERILAVGFKPSTAVITSINNDTTTRFRVKFSENSKRDDFTYESTNLASDIEKYLVYSTEQLDMINSKNNQSNNEQFGYAQSAEIWTQSTLLSELNMEIIDTPGLGSSMFNQTAIYKTISSADALIFVFQIDPGLSSKDIVFLKFIREYLDRCIFVMSKIDMVQNRNYDDLLQFILQTIEGKVGFLPNRVFMVSAKNSLDKNESNNKFSELINAIRTLAKNKLIDRQHFNMLVNQRRSISSLRDLDNL